MFRKTAWRGLHIVLCYCFYRGGCDVDLFSIRRWETFACAAGTSVGSAVLCARFSSSVGACDRLYTRDPFVLYR